MKTAALALALAACALAAPGWAQSSERQFDAGQLGEPDTQVLGFVRFAFGEGGRQKRDPVIGFGFFIDCGRAATRVSSEHKAACANEPIRSLEFSREFSQRDWLISFADDKRWVGLARWYPNAGLARVREFGPVLTGPRFGDEE